tara:strand:- start:37 stop:816 length:780 start_codon:yes stop_codon:yes gene_type:complete
MPKIVDNEPLTEGPDNLGVVVKSNAGFQYEIDMDNRIKKTGRETSGPAGPDNRKADLEVKSALHNTFIKIELKEKLSADFAQMNLDYDTSLNKFYMDETKTSAKAESAQTMIGVAKKKNVIAECNKRWTKVPVKFSMGREQYRDVPTRRLAYEADLINFKDFYMMQGGQAAADAVEEYYFSKQTQYIQIKGYGFYWMYTDKYNIGCPQFAASVRSSSLRLRIKSNDTGKGLYSFLMALKIGALTKSPMDLDKDTSFLPA